MIIRSKRVSSKTSFIASSPLDTRLSSGAWLKLRPWYSCLISSYSRPSLATTRAGGSCRGTSRRRCPARRRARRGRAADGRRGSAALC
ncbi:MAG: hypothetical protein ACE5I1_21710, partial [bacterium]